VEDEKMRRDRLSALSAAAVSEQTATSDCRQLQPMAVDAPVAVTHRPIESRG